MKKIFAAFCAIVLMPSFSAQAWVGGPFSNNTHSSIAGDDGIYEASATAVNGIGLYRFAVGNNFVGVNPQGVQQTLPGTQVIEISPDSGAVTFQTPGIASGNVVIGAWGNTFTSIWFFEGVQYLGRTNGSANSALGSVVGFAEGRDDLGQGANSLTSAFRAKFDESYGGFASSAFRGVGRGLTSQGDRFRFTVIGSRVSRNLFLGL